MHLRQEAEMHPCLLLTDSCSGFWAPMQLLVSYATTAYMSELSKQQLGLGVGVVALLT